MALRNFAFLQVPFPYYALGLSKYLRLTTWCPSHLRPEGWSNLTAISSPFSFPFFNVFFFPHPSPMKLHRTQPDGFLPFRPFVWVSGLEIFWRDPLKDSTEPIRQEILPFTTRISVGFHGQLHFLARFWAVQFLFWVCPLTYAVHPLIGC